MTAGRSSNSPFQTPTRQTHQQALRHPFPPSATQSPANAFGSSTTGPQTSNSTGGGTEGNIEPNLAAQNEQLWKLIEKQRTGYSQMLKELERVRAERDYWRAKATGNSTQTPAPVPSQSSTSVPSQSSTPTPSQSSTSSTPVRPPRKDRQQLHPGTTRQLSADQVTQRTLQQSARSQEPFSTREPSGRSPSHSQSSIPQGQELSTAQLSVSVPPLRSESLPSSTPSSATDERRRTPSAKHSQSVEQGWSQHRRPSLQSEIPSKHTTSDSISSIGSQLSREREKESHRKTSPADSFITGPSASAIGASASASSSAAGSRQSVDTDPATPTANSHLIERTTPITAQIYSSPEASTSRAGSINSTQNQPPIAVGEPGQPPRLPQSHLSPMPSRSLASSRDSRISLPDEAKHYITNMVDSPFPSPQVAGSFPSSNPLSRSETRPEPPATFASSSGGAGLGIMPPLSDSIAESDDGPPLVTIVPASLNKTPRANQQAPVPLDANRLGIDTQVRTRAGDLSSSSSEFLDMYADESTDDDMNSPAISPLDPSTRGAAKTRVDDFPLPPSLSPLRSSSPSHSTADSETDLKRVNGGSIHSNSSATLFRQENPSQVAFRALPLLATDLPHTRIHVSYSSVRPNDRGKDVLSFIVVVSPGKGKEPWKVEKLYSDVMALDQRVKATVPKQLCKKIPTLPEGKLWKDHAPAKVDQRKLSLETYLQTLILLPIKHNDEVIAFFTSDILRDAQKPVVQMGYKEGYLTKRGKNFGGWKSRYFVLQGPVLEYYESRGGAHLGSIVVTGAQIGRQQQATEKPPTTDEEKEYRHAFLIVEAKKAPSGNHPRHVLCAESDRERDSWVEMLVRYFSGAYSEEDVPLVLGPELSTRNAQPTTSRASIGSSPYDVSSQSTPRRPVRAMSRDDVSVNDGFSVKTLQETIDDSSRSGSPAKSLMESSPVERVVPVSSLSDAQTARRILDRGQPSSLPDSSPLSGSAPPSMSPLEASEGSIVSNQRANSEMGHYSDIHSARPRQHSPEKHRTRDPIFQPTLNPVVSAPTTSVSPVDRAPSPDKLDANGKVKISGPLNGAPIPSGFKFGGKDASPEATAAAAANERREKAKSRSFWGFGRPNDKTPAATYIPRAVFGIPLEDSLDVAQIANLPAIVFRSIQYLEAKKADQEEGIYRLSGSSAVIKALKDRFNMEGDIDLLASDEYWDPHAIAGLLKGFLRDLPSSILTRDLHLRFLAVIDFVNAQERIKELSRLIAALPLANYSLLRALTAHLILIVQNSNVNKMTMRNVGIVFSPTLGIPAGVFSLMLGEFNRVFNVDSEAEDDASPAQDVNQGSLDLPSMPVRRNSQRYSDTAADKLLGLSGRALTVPEDDSEGELSIHDESDVESLRTSPIPRIDEPEPPASKRRAEAANRGLNINVNESSRGNRHSRMMGLPSSPRPSHTTHSVPSSPSAMQ